MAFACSITADLQGVTVFWSRGPVSAGLFANGLFPPGLAAYSGRMIASLMMYARPETDAPLTRYWALIRQALDARGIPAPAELSNAAEEFAIWTAPELVLSQTCGMPYRLWLHDRVTLVGTPDFGITDCPPGYYRSAIVVRADDTRQTLTNFANARFIYNQTFSQSGFAAIHAVTRTRGFWFANRSQSHGHVHSARAVAEGRADIAALDAVTWRLIQQYDSFANALRVLEWTPPTPGLPYITAKGIAGSKVFEAVAEAIDSLSEADQKALGLQGIIAIPQAEYRAVSSPPQEDRG